MVEKFWLDPSYANTNRIPLKLKTLYPHSLGWSLFLGLFGMVLSIVGLLMIYAFLDGGLRIALRGIQVSAEVLACDYTPPKGKTNARMDFIIRYRLLDESATTLQNSSFVVGDYLNWRSCNEFPPGSELQVSYQSDMPHRVDIVDSRLQRPWWNTMIVYGSVLAATAFFLIVLIVGVRDVFAYFVSLAHLRVFRQSSRLIEGEIVHCQGKMRGKQRNIFELTICYRFTTPQGVQRQGKQHAQRSDLMEKPLPEPGTPITILYANDHTHCVL